MASHVSDDSLLWNRCGRTWWAYGNYSLFLLYKAFLEHEGVADQGQPGSATSYILDKMRNGSTTSDSQRQRCLENACPQCDQPSLRGQLKTRQDKTLTKTPCCSTPECPSKAARSNNNKQSINESIKTFARAPVTDDHWRRTSNPIKSIDKNRITN